MAAGKYDPQRRWDRNIFAGFWHGPEAGQFAFLDGSARKERVGQLVTARYTYLMNEVPPEYDGWRSPHAP